MSKCFPATTHALHYLTDQLAACVQQLSCWLATSRQN